MIDLVDVDQRPRTGESELSGSGQMALDRVAEIYKLNGLSKDDNKTRYRIYDLEKKLTTDVVQVLEDAIDIPPSKKVQFVLDILPIVSWYHDETTRERIANNSDIAHQRQSALRGFLSSIPDDLLDDKAIDELLKVKHELTKYVNLLEIDYRIGGRIGKFPVEKSKSYMDKLDPKAIWSKDGGNYGSAWIEAMKNWDVEDQKPYVLKLFDFANNAEMLTKYGFWYLVPEAIKRWPQKDQDEMIRRVLIKDGIDAIPAKKFYGMMSNWSSEESKPLLKELLSLPLKPRIGADTADSDYGQLAGAMKNWSSDEINDFLGDENNTRWVRDVAIIKSQENSIFRISYDENYAKYLNGFRLSSLMERTAEFDYEHIGWITEAFDQGHRREAASVIVKNPQLFSPELASRMFATADEATKAVELFCALPKENQPAFRSSVADLLMGDASFGYSKLTSKIISEILQRWTPKEIDDLVIELLSRGIEEVGKYRFSQFRGKTSNVVNAFKLLQQRSVITDQEIIKGILEYSIVESEGSEFKAASALVSKIEKSEITDLLIVKAAGNAVSSRFREISKESLAQIKDIVTKYSLADITLLRDKLPPYIQSIVDFSGISNSREFIEFVEKNYEYVNRLAKTPDELSILDNKDISNLSKIHLTLWEAETVKRSGVNLLGIKEDGDFGKVLDILETMDEWGDVEVILNPFDEGAKIFGYKRMFEFVDRDGLTRHDALHAFPKVIDLYLSSGLSADDFFGNILRQVNMDGARYESGTPHHELNAIANTINLNFDEIEDTLRDLPNDEDYQEISRLLRDPHQIFSSWQKLKYASSRLQILENRELLDQLESLRGANEKQYKYLKTLLLHPGSKVDSRAVQEFWLNPERFFSRMATHTLDEIQDRKKVSNYLHIPNCPLTAEQLRDSLINGTLDELQVFTPLEIKYRIPVVRGEYILDLRDLATKAIGKRGEKIAGLALKPKELYKNLKVFFEEQNLNVNDFLQGHNLEVSSEQSSRISEILLDSDCGLVVDAWETVIAQIHAKSDPMAAIAGDDTNNCMPYGDGKTTVYMFNLNTAQFALQIERIDGTRRTIAQSVMTKDVDLGVHLATKYMEYLTVNDRDGTVPLDDEGKPDAKFLWRQLLTEDISVLMKLVPQNVISRSVSVVAADNVEVAPNWQTDKYKKVISTIYQDFFAEYMSKNAKSENIQPDKVVIGKGYSDALTDLPVEDNNFVPQAPVSYSDKLADKVHTLDLTRVTQRSFQREVDHRERPKSGASYFVSQSRGISLLTAEDSLTIAYLEGKIYADNPGLMQHLHNLENGLIGMQINNAYNKLPPMAIKYANQGGEIKGYMFAFEGRIEEDSNDEYDDESNYGERVVYIMDLAADKSDLMAGGRLINSFIEMYQRNYLEKNDLVPVYAEARETTSYKIIVKQMNKIGEKLGIHFELEEIRKEDRNGDVMHNVMIRPVKVE